jgi:TonB-linked SusC/RagA family outer membrane protein
MKGWIQGVAALALTLAVVQPLSAQQQQPARGTITGQVTLAENGAPAPTAQVFIVGSSIGALTGTDGRFTLLNVPVGPRTVRVQLLGYSVQDQTANVTAGRAVVLNFSLKQEAVVVPQLVVTALGVQSKEKSLGYAVQQVNKVAIERSPEINLINTIAGQSPGVQVTAASGQPGSSSRIVIRGESSFTGDGQPLFVIDGVPISIQQDDRPINTNQLEFGSMGSRAMDLDPANIEEMTILRGAAATALYGSRAAFGAIVIKTKMGTPGQPVRFSVSSTFTNDFPILGGVQTTYAQGANGYFCNGRTPEQGGWCQPGYPGTNPNPVSNNSWGPHRDSIPQVVLDSVGDLRFRDPRKDFYEIAQTYVNSVGISGSLPQGAYNFNLSRTDQGGIFPGTKLDRTAVQANITAKLSNNLQSNTTVMYTNSLNITANEGYSSLVRTLAQMPVTRDISRAWQPDGSPVMLGNNSPHPTWLSLNEGNRSQTGRWIGSQSLTLTLTPGISLMNRIGVDTYTDERLFYQNERPWQTIVGANSGGTDQQKIQNRQIENNMMLTVENRRIGESAFTVGGFVGTAINAREESNLIASGDNILVPGNYNINNFQSVGIGDRSRLATKRRLLGVYGQLTADFRDYLFLTATGRNDWSSTLPKNNNNYFYPSVSMSLIFTDAFGISNDILQYGKIRVSRSKVGSDAPAYRLDTRYGNAGGAQPFASISQNGCCGLSFPLPQQGGVPAYVQSSSLGNPELRPESIVETELGLELRLFQGKIRSQISYYDKKSYDQIFDVPSSAATGYTNITRNAGDLRNKGWEVSVNTTPVRTRDLQWDFTANWSRNRGTVIELAPGVPSIFLTGYSWPQVRVMEGYSYGVIWGYGYKRDENGNLMVCGKTVSAECPAAGSSSTTNPNGSEGWPLLDDQLKVLGETQHDWMGSLNTQVRYKAFTISGLLDTKQGGMLLNFDLQYSGPLGKSKITETRGDMYTFKGVNVDTGEPNTKQLERNEAFWRRYLAFDLHENMLEDASSVRLREATLRYDLSPNMAGKIGAQSMHIYATGRNLKVWTPSSKGDPDGSNYGAANAGGASYSFFQAPQTRSWVLGVRAQF